MTHASIPLASLGSLLLASAALQGVPPSTAAAKPDEALAALLRAPVARVGSQEITAEAIVSAAEWFYPEVRAEFAGGYGEAFLASGVFDDWVDAYIDLLILRREPRVKGFMPSREAFDRALREWAASVPARLPAAGETPARDAPSDTRIERTRRLHGFEAARQAQLDELVPLVTDRETLQRRLVLSPMKAVGRLRMRTIVLSTRDPLSGKRLPFARRARVREDAQRLYERLQAGESFETIQGQVRGAHDERPVETLPWISFDAPFPAPLLRALFEASPDQIHVGPLETRDGWVIARIEDRTRIVTPDFEELVEPLASSLRRDSQYELLQKLRGEVDIVVH